MGSTPASPKRRRFHRGYLLIAVILALVLYFGSLALFPDWGQSVSLLLALAVVVIGAVVTFLSDFRTAFAPHSENAATSIQQSTTVSGGVGIEANTVSTRDVTGRDKIVSAGGDVVEGDQIIYEAQAPLASALHQLPAPPRDFTGRTADLDAILNDIEHGAVISGVRGMGGIGKTALALVIAEQLKAQYPDAQFFVPLRGASDAPVKPLDAMQSVIRAYHPKAKLPDDEAGLKAQYLSDLHGKRAIILLDDARDANQIRPLLPPTSCLLLVTTRNTFAVPGLKVKDLNVLRPEDARDLLIAIAPRLTPTPIPGPSPVDEKRVDRGKEKAAAPSPVRVVGERGRAGAGAADEIARLCGCLPLALRAAASLIAATPDLNPLAYVTQLRDERTRLTKIGKEGVEIDVEASLNLSYRQLSPEAARVFRQLSVFPATFDAEAAEAVCEDTDHAHLSQLVRLSLVQYEAPIPGPSPVDEKRVDRRREKAAPSPVPHAVRGTGEGWGGGAFAGRYQLHDLARLFADALLTDDERAAALYHHAAHYLSVLRQAQEFYLQGNDGILQGLTLFDREWPNMQAGQAWAATHAENDDEAAVICSDYPHSGIYILLLRQHPRDQIKWMEQALTAARRMKDRTDEGVHLGNLGIAYKNLGETRKAIEFYEQILVIHREIGDRRGEGADLGNLGLTYADLGETRKAIKFYEQALIIDREIGNRRGEEAALVNLGLAYAGLGETRKAIKFYEQALVIMREIGDRLVESSIVGNLGLAYANLGETRKAIEYHEQALVIAREIGDRRGEGAALGNLGIAYADLSETRQAIEFFEQHRDIAREIGDRRGEGNALGNLGNAYSELGQRQQAIDYYNMALAIVREIGDRRGEGVHLWNMADEFNKLGERAQAIAHAEASLRIKEAIEAPNAEMVRRQLAQWRGQS